MKCLFSLLKSPIMMAVDNDLDINWAITVSSSPIKRGLISRFMIQCVLIIRPTVLSQGKSPYKRVGLISEH